jgi:hypothetical protein
MPKHGVGGGRKTKKTALLFLAGRFLKLVAAEAKIALGQ